MPLLPLNSVGGYSTGITGTAVIDANGNITGVGATFSSLVRFNAGISAAGGTLSSIFNIPSGITLQTAISTGNDRYLRISPTEFKVGTTQTLSTDGVIQLNYTTTIDSTTVPSYYGTVPLIVKGSATPSATTANLTNWTVGATTVASIISSGGFSGPASRFSGLITANAGISAAGGTFGNAISVNGNITTTGSINASGGATFAQSIKTTDIVERIDFGLVNGGLYLNNKALSYTSIGAIGKGNQTALTVVDDFNQIILENPYGLIYLGDSDGIDSGLFISYEAMSGQFSGNSNSAIVDFNTISSINGFYETANSIRVTNNARSWFL